ADRRHGSGRRADDLRGGAGGGDAAGSAIERDVAAGCWRRGGARAAIGRGDPRGLRAARLSAAEPGFPGSWLPAGLHRHAPAGLPEGQGPAGGGRGRGAGHHRARQCRRHLRSRHPGRAPSPQIPAGRHLPAAHQVAAGHHEQAAQASRGPACRGAVGHSVHR
ncbi:hypothetical protein OY671_011536, partial [Metschnikowia pulcherrima]